MKSIAIRFVLLFLFFSSISCKNNTTPDSEVSAIEGVTAESDKEAKKVITEEEKFALKSVMSKIMVSNELSSFSSALVTAGLTDMLLKENGPYTIFAPSNQAFENLSEAERKELYNKANLSKLKEILQNHMVEGNLTSALLKEKDNAPHNGMAGSQLVVFYKNGEPWVKDEKGNEAKITQQDILGNNGVVHVIDQVLNMD